MSSAAATRRQKQLARTVYDYGAVVFGNPASRPDGHGGNDRGGTWGGQQPASITRADDGHAANEDVINCTPELFRVISAAAAKLKGGGDSHSGGDKKRKHKKKKHKHKKHKRSKRDDER